MKERLNAEGFSPNEDIEDYLIDPLNKHFFNEITRKLPNIKQGVLEFFNLLFRQYRIVEIYYNKPLSVEEHLKEIELDNIQRFYLLTFLLHLLEASEDYKNKFAACKRGVREIRYSLIKELAWTREEAFYYAGDDIEVIQKFFDDQPSIFNKIEYLLKLKSQYENLDEYVGEEIYGSYMRECVKRCDSEIQKLRSAWDSGNMEAEEPKGGNLSHNEPTRDNGEEKLKDTIASRLSFMREIDPRKHKLILEEQDYQKLINYTFEYFRELKVPCDINPIKKVNTIKGNILFTYYLLFKELHPGKTIPESLVEFLHITFVKLKEDGFDEKKFTESNIYKNLGREPDYYKFLPVKIKK